MTHTVSGSVLLATLILSGNAFSAGDTASVTIRGRVVSNTCTIDTSSSSQTITLADIADRDISGPGKTGGDKEVVIVLKDCGESASNVRVQATGQADSNDDSAFANTQTDGAKGVGLYFYHTDGITRFKPDGNQTETSPLVPQQDNTLTYKASYVGTSNTVTAGEFSTVVNLQFEYL